MGLSVTTIAPTRRLTTRDMVKTKLGLLPSYTSDDALFDFLIARASDAIERWCTRKFARENVTETLPGYGEIWLMLERTPIASVSSVMYDQDAITDWVLDDPDGGRLYRQVGWFWTAQVIAGLVGKQRWPGVGDPLPRQEEPRFTVSYIAGYLLPAQDLRDPVAFPASLTSAGVSALASDNSFNDVNNGFPSLLQAGDVIETSGFAAQDNGRFLVTGTPTAGKIQVSGNLVNDGPHASGASLAVSTLPPSLEEACVEEVKSRYLDRQKAPHTKRERVADLDIEYADPVGLPPGLCVNTVGLLMPFRRAA